MTNETIDMDVDAIPLIPEVEEAEHPTGIEMTEWTFSNDKTNPAISQIFHLFYNGVFKNKLGVAHCRVKGTDKVHTVLVGIDVSEAGQIALLPLAKVLGDDELNIYEAPDGNGGYITA